MLAPPTRVNFGCITTQAREKGARHDHYRSRLSPERSANWIGDAAEIKRQRVRKQKTDREDARLVLKLLLENRFPRIWVPSPENRDLRQLLWHRHRLVHTGHIVWEATFGGGARLEDVQG
jgi:hypothetical protein